MEYESRRDADDAYHEMHNKRIGRDDLLKIEVSYAFMATYSYPFYFISIIFNIVISGQGPRLLPHGASIPAVTAGVTALHLAVVDHPLPDVPVETIPRAEMIDMSANLIEATVTMNDVTATTTAETVTALVTAPAAPTREIATSRMTEKDARRSASDVTRSARMARMAKTGRVSSRCPD